MKKKTSKTPSPKKLTKEQKTLGLMTLYGGLMANLLNSIAERKDFPDDIRFRAGILQDKWVAVSPYKPINPITIIEIEKALQ